MRVKKYTSISLPPEIIETLNQWQEAYAEFGTNLTKEKLLLQILSNHRKFLWRDKDRTREIVTNYKAICLSKRDGISFEEAKEKVIENDNNTSTNRWGSVTTYKMQYSRYILDKDIDTIEASGED